jgi:hypothetical protein
MAVSSSADKAALLFAGVAPTNENVWAARTRQALTPLLRFLEVDR